MRAIFLSAIFLSILAGCTEPNPPRPCHGPYHQAPPVDLPPGYRHENYAGGSCMWAATQDLLAWQGRSDLAEWMRENRSGEAHALEAAGVLASCGLTPVLCEDTGADGERFLTWCSHTRRGAAIYWAAQCPDCGQEHPANHAVTFCGFSNDGRTALVINSNAPDQYLRLDRAEFLRRWRESGGVALTIVGTPRPPRPWI